MHQTPYLAEFSVKFCKVLFPLVMEVKEAESELQENYDLVEIKAIEVEAKLEGKKPFDSSDSVD